MSIQSEPRFRLGQEGGRRQRTHKCPQTPLGFWVLGLSEYEVERPVGTAGSQPLADASFISPPSSNG